MNAEQKAIEQQARELLAQEYERDNEGSYIAARIRSGKPMWWADEVGLRALTRALTRPAPTDAEVEAAKWIRAWRNRFISERMNAYPDESYELRRANAETDANDFEEAFRERMARAALGEWDK